MRKFYELISQVRMKFPTDNFFQDFEASLNHEAKRISYQAYAEAMKLLDDESWIILKEKCISHFLDHREGQLKQGFFNQLNEVFAYQFLVHRGFGNIRLIRETTEKRPDICFFDRESYYCEVKTVGISDDEIRRRSLPVVHDSAVYSHLSVGFMNKLGKNVDDAWKQINSVGQKGLVFVLVRLDDIAQDYHETYRKQLTEFCRDRRNVLIKLGHVGNDLIL